MAWVYKIWVVSAEVWRRAPAPSRILLVITLTPRQHTAAVRRLVCDEVG